MEAEFDQERADRLMSEAFEALEMGEPKSALKIAKELKRMRYSGCFEIQALAYADLGKRTKAIKVLRDGTERCPDVWLLWQLLGNNLSDEDRFEEAFEAYEKGLNADQADLASLSANYAIALIRSGEMVRARERIRPFLEAPGFHEIEGSLRARILAVELEALRKSGDCDAAVACFEGIGNACFGDHAGAELSMCWSEYAHSLLELGRRDEAEKAAIRAAWFDSWNETALWLLREVRRKPTDTETNQYRLVVEGDWCESTDHANDKLKGFFASYSVCADNEEEALSFVAELQPDQVRNLRISKADLETKTTEPKGVHSTGDHNLYPKEENQD
jgi:tetratricopeptide (TPR) repeat protein